MKFDLYHILCTAAVISYFIPLVLVLLRGLWHDKFFLLFALYWATGGLINSPDLIPAFPSEIMYTIGVVYNLLDIPVILTIFYYTGSSPGIRKLARAGLIAIILIELTSVALAGFDYNALKYTIGPGILVVMVIVVWEILRYLQKIEHSNRQTAKVFIYAALLFEYATFILIYIFDYFIVDSAREDSFLIYYISTVVAIVIASSGYLLFRKKYAYRSIPIRNDEAARD